MGLALEPQAEFGFLRCEPILRASDTDSAGARDVVDVLEVGEVGVRLGGGHAPHGNNPDPDDVCPMPRGPSNWSRATNGSSGRGDLACAGNTPPSLTA